MRRFSIVITAIVLVILLVAAEVIIIRSASNYEPTMKVVFTKGKIPVRTRITADMLELKEVGLSLASRQSVKSLDDAVSKFAKTQIEQGEILLSSRLSADEFGQPEVKDRNSRLFSIEFKGDQANGWWLRKDQYVDILFVPDEKRQDPSSPSAVVPEAMFPGKTVLNGKVRIIDEIRIAALLDDRGKPVDNPEGNLLPKYVSFEVTDQQADFLAFAKSNGRLELSVIPGK